MKKFTLSPEALAKLNALVAKSKEPKAEATIAPAAPATISSPLPAISANFKDFLTPEMTWNEEQLAAIERAFNGESFCLIGKAGTGKTTATKEIINVLMRSGKIGPLTDGSKFLQQDLPGVAIVSFTNRAVNNIRKGLPGDIAPHCLTLHKLLEFEPVYFEVETAAGEWKKTMRFVPKRNSINPLPSSLKLIIFEESSMIQFTGDGASFEQLKAACPHNPQMIFLGDLQQLPPVYGDAVLGFKLCELPTVELTKIYRQAADSPIISLAWNIASGKTIPASQFDAMSVPGKLKFRPWKKQLDADGALQIMDKLFQQLIDSNEYDPMQDMVMMPFNKSFGTTEFNRNLAQYLGEKRNAMVFEIVAGFEKHYYAVGDKILADRQEAIITEIVVNGDYTGSTFAAPPSSALNRWGGYNADHENIVEKSAEEELAEIELMMSASMKEQEDKKNQATHIVRAQVIGSDHVIELKTTGEFNASTFAYALTVHKCQGSEWRKCFLLLHKSHAVMLSRELLYTAVTRAREELYIICEPNSFLKGVETQRIQGSTIAEKAEWFKGKVERNALEQKGWKFK